MMKVFVLTLLTACTVHCNVASRFSQKGIFSSNSDVAVDKMIKAKDYAATGIDYPKIYQQKPVDCTDILAMNYNKSGIYLIWPVSTPNVRVMQGKSFYVYCDMDTDGGGWIVIQRRGDFKRPKDYFYRNWDSYKNGFGKMEEDFWLGNDKIFALTNQKIYSARFDLKDVQGDKRYALYDEFWLDDEKHNYTLHIDLYSGNAGDSMRRHNTKTFFTFDRDNVYNCAKVRKGAWWYDDCYDANLNGLYYKGKNGNSIMDGLSWVHWKGALESLEWTEIKIRPKHFRATFA